MTEFINNKIENTQVVNTDSSIKKIVDITLGAGLMMASPALIASGIYYSTNKGQAVAGAGLIILGYLTYRIGDISFTPPSQRPIHLGGTLDDDAYSEYIEKKNAKRVEDKQAYLKIMNEKYATELKEYFNLGVKGIN